MFAKSAFQMSKNIPAGGSGERPLGARFKSSRRRRVHSDGFTRRALGDTSGQIDKERKNG
jgi:hypothetical protein